MRRMESSPADANARSHVWTTRAVRAAAVAGVGVSVVAMLDVTQSAQSTALLLFSVCMLLTCARIAHVPPRIRVREGDASPPARSPTLVVIAAWLAQVGLVAGLAILDPVLLLPATLIMAQVHLLMHAERDFPAAGVLALTAAQALVAFLFLPSGLTMLSLPVALAIAVTGGVLVHGRASRRNLKRALRGVDLPAPSRRGLGARARFAVVLSFVALLFALLLQSVLRNVTEALTDAFTPAPVQQNEFRPEHDQRPVQPGANGLPTGESLDQASSFSSQVDFDQPFYGTGDKLLLRVKPTTGTVPARGLGPIYLRCSVLDEITSKGVRMSRRPRLRTLTDAGDGRTDSWTSVVMKPFPVGGRQWEIEQVPLRLTGYGRGSIIPTVDPIHGVQRPSVLWDPDQAMVHFGPVNDWFTFEQRADLPPTAGIALRGRKAVHAQKIFKQLPVDTTALRRIRRDARRITKNKTSDYDRTRAIIEHFNNGFTYSTETPKVAGLEGLSQFLDDREGYCIQYASTSVVMLRSLGIASRVVQGFLATEWIATASLYDVYPPDLHAWIEVHFAGIGWVRFDPTPAAERLAALSQGGQGLGGWADELGSMLEQWASEGDMMSLDELASLLARGPGALVRSVGRGALLIAAIVFVAVGIFLVMPSRRRKKRSLAQSVERTSARQAREHYERMLHALSRLGHRKRRAQTPREFALALVATRDDVLQPLGELTERVYATRFGDDEFTTDDVARVDAFIQALREAERVRL